MIAWLRRLLFAPVVGCDDCDGVTDCARCGPLERRTTVEDVRRLPGRKIEAETCDIHHRENL